MLMSDSYLFDVGWLFFAAWAVIVAAISLAAFGRDLLPPQTPLEQSSKPPAERSANVVVAVQRVANVP
jgi:hypothetical protein